MSAHPCANGTIAPRNNPPLATPAQPTEKIALVAKPLPPVDPHLIDIPPGNRIPTLELIAPKLLPSVEKYGILVPVLLCVREEAPGRYWSVDGACRVECAKIRGLRVPAVDVGRMLTDREKRLYRVATSHIRNSLDPYQLLDEIVAEMKDCGCTQGEAAANLGISEGEASRTMRMKDLAEDLRPLVEGFDISPSKAKLIASVGCHDQQRQLMKDAIAKGWDKATVQRKVSEAKGTKKAPKQAGAKVSFNGVSATVKGDPLAALEGFASKAAEVVKKLRRDNVDPKVALKILPDLFS